MTAKWLIRRIGFVLLVLFFAVCMNFVLPRLIPGSIVDYYIADGTMDQQSIAILEAKFGLDKPTLTQFGIYLKNTFTGEFGLSFSYYPVPVMTKIKEALPYSLSILCLAMLLREPMAIILGTVAGWRPGSKRDSIVQAVSLMLMAMPTFWVGMCLLYIFAYKLGWFPLSGAFTAAEHHPHIFAWLWDWIRHAFLPLLTLMHLFGAGQLVMRNTMVTTLKEHYLTTAEAKGLGENMVKYKHAARNALLPVITGMVMQFTLTLTGSIYIETVFSYPGIGKLMFNAVQTSDYPLIQGCFFFYAVITLASIVLIDIIYTRLDPRIRYH
ncbi:ABC transporter permease [Chloroflexota bacterium]